MICQSDKKSRGTITELEGNVKMATENEQMEKTLGTYPPNTVVLIKRGGEIADIMSAENLASKGKKYEDILLSIQKEEKLNEKRKEGSWLTGEVLADETVHAVALLYETEKKEKEWLLNKCSNKTLAERLEKIQADADNLSLDLLSLIEELAHD